MQPKLKKIAFPPLAGSAIGVIGDNFKRFSQWYGKVFYAFLYHKKVFTFLLCFLLCFEQSGFAQMAGQLDISGHLAGLGNAFTPDVFRPLHLRYLSYNPLENNFQLFLDKGSLKNPNPQELQDTTKTLLNYFFIGITLPNDTFWVNLRPDAEDNIIDEQLAQTDVGKIMLETDLQLKKDTARFTSPETPEGREYWDKLYRRAGEIFGSENITIPTLTRPWIVPDEIIIRETADSAYIYKATLKVMLEQDYLKDSAIYNFKDERLKELNEYSSQLIRELIIPKLTKEVNSSKRYASLRQVYYSLIMAQWFKARNLGKDGLYSHLINRKDLTNLTSKESWSKTTYFKEYQKSFKDGEYNIQESGYRVNGQTIRSYFSGGEVFNLGRMPPMGEMVRNPETGATVSSIPTAASTLAFNPKVVIGVKVNATDNLGELGEVEIREGSSPAAKLPKTDTAASSPASQSDGRNLKILISDLMKQEHDEKLRQRPQLPTIFKGGDGVEAVEYRRYSDQERILAWEKDYPSDPALLATYKKLADLGLAPKILAVIIPDRKDYPNREALINVLSQNNINYSFISKMDRQSVSARVSPYDSLGIDISSYLQSSEGRDTLLQFHNRFSYSSNFMAVVFENGGISLSRALNALSNDPAAVLLIAENLGKTIASLHNEGVLIDDAHAGQYVVDPDFKVRRIDVLRIVQDGGVIPEVNRAAQLREIGNFTASLSFEHVAAAEAQCLAQSFYAQFLLSYINNIDRNRYPDEENRIAFGDLSRIISGLEARLEKREFQENPEIEASIAHLIEEFKVRNPVSRSEIQASRLSEEFVRYVNHLKSLNLTEIQSLELINKWIRAQLKTDIRFTIPLSNADVFVKWLFQTDNASRFAMRLVVLSEGIVDAWNDIRGAILAYEYGPFDYDLGEVRLNYVSVGDLVMASTQHLRDREVEGIPEHKFSFIDDTATVLSVDIHDWLLPSSEEQDAVWSNQELIKATLTHQIGRNFFDSNEQACLTNYGIREVADPLLARENFALWFIIRFYGIGTFIRYVNYLYRHPKRVLFIDKNLAIAAVGTYNSHSATFYTEFNPDLDRLNHILSEHYGENLYSRFESSPHVFNEREIFWARIRPVLFPIQRTIDGEEERFDIKQGHWVLDWSNDQGALAANIPELSAEIVTVIDDERPVNNLMKRRGRGMTVVVTDSPFGIPDELNIKVFNRLYSLGNISFGQYHILTKGAAQFTALLLVADSRDNLFHFKPQGNFDREKTINLMIKIADRLGYELHVVKDRTEIGGIIFYIKEKYETPPMLRQKILLKLTNRKGTKKEDAGDSMKVDRLGKDSRQKVKILLTTGEIDSQALDELIESGFDELESRAKVLLCRAFNDIGYRNRNDNDDIDYGSPPVLAIKREQVRNLIYVYHDSGKLEEIRRWLRKLGYSDIQIETMVRMLERGALTINNISILRVLSSMIEVRAREQIRVRERIRQRVELRTLVKPVVMHRLNNVHVGFNIRSSSPVQSAISSVEIQSQAIHPGGIDFRSLPIVIQAVSNLSANISSSAIHNLVSINLDEEWRQIERMASSEITPSSERIKEYIQTSCAQDSITQDRDKILLCISDILRLEEERCDHTDTTLRDILVVLESMSNAQELRQVFLGKVI